MLDLLITAVIAILVAALILWAVDRFLPEFRTPARWVVGVIALIVLIYLIMLLSRMSPGFRFGYG